jgi:hypothetical protein
MSLATFTTEDMLLAVGLEMPTKTSHTPAEELESRGGTFWRKSGLIPRSTMM